MKLSAIKTDHDSFIRLGLYDAGVSLTSIPRRCHGKLITLINQPASNHHPLFTTTRKVIFAIALVFVLTLSAPMWALGEFLRSQFHPLHPREGLPKYDVNLETKGKLKQAWQDLLDWSKKLQKYLPPLTHTTLHSRFDSVPTPKLTATTLNLQPMPMNRVTMPDGSSYVMGQFPHESDYSTFWKLSAQHPLILDFTKSGEITPHYAPLLNSAKTYSGDIKVSCTSALQLASGGSLYEYTLTHGADSWKVQRLQVSDELGSSIPSHETLLALIKYLDLLPNKVTPLLHCSDGVNRSALFACARTLVHQKSLGTPLSLDSLIHVIKTGRSQRGADFLASHEAFNFLATLSIHLETAPSVLPDSKVPIPDAAH